jgi:hypothetical protein
MHALQRKDVLAGLAAAGLGLFVVWTSLDYRIGTPAVTAALVAFALTVERLGFIPATVLLIFISGVAERPIQWRALALLSLVLAPAAYALFVLFLGIPVPAFAWGAAS